jgi:ribosome-associated protein
LLDSPLDQDGNPIWAGPSKSHVRREASAVSELALRLAKLPRGRRVELQLGEELSQALELADQLSKGAYQRQLRLIAKLLRALPNEIREQLEQLSSPGYRPGPNFDERLYERWRLRLVNEGDSALSEFVAEFPSVERQRLRQLVRQAKSEPATPRSQRALRELLRAVRSAHRSTSTDAQDTFGFDEPDAADDSS